MYILLIYYYRSTTITPLLLLLLLLLLPLPPPLLLLPPLLLPLPPPLLLPPQPPLLLLLLRVKQTPGLHPSLPPCVHSALATALKQANTPEFQNYQEQVHRIATSTIKLYYETHCD